LTRSAQRAALVAGLVVVAIGIAWLLFVGLPRWYGGPAARGPEAASAAPLPPGRKIKARLFYVAEGGTKLTAVERDVAYGEGTVEQAREIINAQIAPAAEPLVSAVPAATRLHALFVTPQGEAYVDLSGDVSRAHAGGSLNELLTIYTIVDALTANLPAVSSVQILVDGKEVDTLAGHVDLRRPLMKNLDVVE
jgi:sporulation and spore germination protein